MRAVSGKNYLHMTYSLAVIAAGLVLLVGLFGDLDLDRSREFALLILLGILMEWLAVDFPLGRLSGGFSLVLASLLVYNLSASVWISSVAFFIGSGIASRGNSFRTSAFNMAQQVLTLYGSVYLTGLIWGREITASTILSGPAGGFVQLINLIVLYFVINHILVYLYAYPGRDGARMHTWRDTLRWDALSYFFSTPFGIVMAILYQKTGVMALLLLVAPVLAVQFMLRLYVRSELVNKELRAVYEINRRLGDRTALDEIPGVLLKEMRRAIAFHTGVVYLREEEGRRFRAAAAYGPYREQLERDCLIPGEGFLGWVINNGEPEIVFDSKIDPRVKSDQGLPQVLRSLLAIPLAGEAGSLGLVVVGDKRAMSFSEQDLQVAVSLCGTVTVALSGRVLARRMEDLGSRDAMTGLLNRKTFYHNCCRVFDKFLAAGEGKVALVLMDLDILGHINEGWGQEIGDRMIAECGRLLRSVDMPESQAGRYGDDEFALLLPGFDEQKALFLAHEIRGELADYAFSEEYPLLRIKVSVGLAVAPEDGESFDQLLKAAARALERAKKNGRDRIVAFSDLKGRSAGRSSWIT
ncbi:MAG: sensor domain-containing diguanylate cyclase [Peptococcaceae bacterium]|nr:sensor domain-containing diguanylate cyclase [Peptococcaceae bacterium]